MPFAKMSSWSCLTAFVKPSCRGLLRRTAQRRVICFALTFNIFLWPGPGLAAHHVFDFISQGASSVLYTRLLCSSYEAYFIKHFLPRSRRATAQDTPADRVAAVRRLQVNPSRYVGYVGQSIAFRALPLNSSSQTIQGVRLDWESSNTDKVVIDDGGLARLLQPGLVRIVCRAGSVQASVPLLVRPGTRPRQSDVEWQADQRSLAETTTDGSSANTLGDLADSLLNHLTPTVQAQAGWIDDLPYDELWNDPRNLVGNPPHRAAESTMAGIVLPEGSNFDFAAPIISLSGRGIGTDLSLHYNSRLWSRRNNSMAYDAIVGWPGPGFSLGFGRIVTYEITAGGNPTCKYMLIDPNGTRHYLGSGLWGGGGFASGGPYETNDGSHIVYTGNARDGGDLIYSDGTIKTFRVVNNRLLPISIADTNGNFLQIAYKPECVQVGGEQFCQLFAPMAIDYVTDTMGRVIQFNYDSNYRLSSITAPGLGGTAENPVTQTIAQFDYQTVTVSGAFSGLTVERGAGGTALKHVYFPATGTGYLFTTSTYGVISTVSARRQMSASQYTIQDGVENNSVSFNYRPQRRSAMRRPSLNAQRPR